ncbi:hypothetical protein BB560_006683 [Smittium megazygosporum]|uniref:Nucleoporin NSP1-like C-terminal domain-containing protein n=1 Tax=Smittium megazygosporum TaxID=133381 RepID=A0A2T9Y2F8_9FUNG|nr:hypothetical protein BB560_006683 [Smittium megazygosporum]
MNFSGFSSGSSNQKQDASAQKPVFSFGNNSSPFGTANTSSSNTSAFPSLSITTNTGANASSTGASSLNPSASNPTSTSGFGNTGAFGGSTPAFGQSTAANNTTTQPANFLQQKPSSATNLPSLSSNFGSFGTSASNQPASTTNAPSLSFGSTFGNKPTTTANPSNPAASTSLFSSSQPAQSPFSFGSQTTNNTTTQNQPSLFGTSSLSNPAASTNTTTNTQQNTLTSATNQPSSLFSSASGLGSGTSNTLQLSSSAPKTGVSFPTSSGSNLGSSGFSLQNQNTSAAPTTSLFGSGNTAGTGNSLTTNSGSLFGGISGGSTTNANQPGQTAASDNKGAQQDQTQIKDAVADISSALLDSNTLGDIIDNWTTELVEQIKLFSNQAQEAKSFELQLDQQGQDLARLDELSLKAEADQEILDKTLDFMENQQKTLIEHLDVFEPITQDLVSLLNNKSLVPEPTTINSTNALRDGFGSPHSVQGEREEILSNAENLNIQIDGILKHLSRLVEQANDISEIEKIKSSVNGVGIVSEIGGAQAGDSISLITKTLNAHLTTLKSLESEAEKLSDKVEKIESIKSRGFNASESDNYPQVNNHGIQSVPQTVNDDQARGSGYFSRGFKPENATTNAAGSLGRIGGGLDIYPGFTSPSARQQREDGTYTSPFSSRARTRTSMGNLYENEGAGSKENANAAERVMETPTRNSYSGAGPGPGPDKSSLHTFSQSHNKISTSPRAIQSPFSRFIDGGLPPSAQKPSTRPLTPSRVSGFMGREQWQ